MKPARKFPSRMIMKRIEPIKKPLHGVIACQVTNPLLIRAVIFGSIAHGRTRIDNLSGGEDNSRTVRAFRQLGVEIGRDIDALCVEGKGFAGLHQAGEAIDCGNSGTTIRLMSGLLAGLPFHSELDGDASIRQRPMQRVIDPLTQMGAKIRSKGDNGRAPLENNGGGLHGTRYRMPIASAQVKSAIQLAALRGRRAKPILRNRSARAITPRVMIRGFAARSASMAHGFFLKGGQTLRGQDVRIPANISSAAFFMVAGGDDSRLRLTDKQASVGIRPATESL
jgi:3-phosphoshikimate 1-carboxyvinyltransferase